MSTRFLLKLHTQGVVKSVEVYQDSKLVGGLYGVSMGKVFFGESNQGRAHLERQEKIPQE
jgi:leucyl/phenylalanyl-tRNA--protein transferase